jgi:hypothetical protein
MLHTSIVQCEQSYKICWKIAGLKLYTKGSGFFRQFKVLIHSRILLHKLPVEFNLKLQHTLYCYLQTKNHLRPFWWTCDKYFPTSINFSLFCVSLLNKYIVSCALYVNLIIGLGLSARKVAMGKIFPLAFPFPRQYHSTSVTQLCCM